ncbi:MAG: SRPBCC domain-containing protein [Gammaproteobacteria bacterium]|nr:SRPBCC domain-containing protein [Gammaproteobacteria bacterium]MDH3468917.1 SRPBCC domain-containing protein [Gammaproteobacteria bacterium]
MSEPEIKLVINKEINAPVEAVYTAWTDPETMKKWFAPGDNMTVPEANVDLRVGGAYLIHMHDADAGSDHIVSGEYEEIVPNEKLVFNWMWKDGIDRTQVTVEMRAQGSTSTLLTLTHRGFSQQEFADKHNEGWGGCLANLSSHLA